jgi:hypothetical protein
MLGSEFFTQQTSKPNLIKLMDRLNTLPRSLKSSLHKTLSGMYYFGDGQYGNTGLEFSNGGYKIKEIFA